MIYYIKNSFYEVKLIIVAQIELYYSYSKDIKIQLNTKTKLLANFILFIWIIYKIFAILIILIL